MHHGAQHARAVAAALVAAAEALCIRGGCTLVQRMAVAMRWLPPLVDGLRLQQLVLAVTTPHERAQQPATAMVFRCCGLHGYCAQSDSVLWCAIWMQWMHHGAQPARAVAAALVAAAEALYTHGSCTLVQQRQ